mgnify:CR=1 FL=1
MGTLLLFNNPNSRIFKQSHLDKTHEFYKKYGGKTIIIARFVPIVRTFAPFVAGMGKMHYHYFMVYNLIGGAAWVALFCYAGYFFGDLPVVQENLKLLIVAIIVISILPAMDERTRLDTLWKDSLTIDTIMERAYTHFSPDDVILRCFKERVLSQRLIRSERPESRKFSFYFSTQADSLPLLKGLNFDETNAFIVEKPTGRIDTLHYWIRDSLIYKMDTLKMSLTYLYTDTLNQLVPRTDTLRLVSKIRPKSEKELEKEREKKEKELEKAKKKAEKEGKEYVEPTVFLPVDVYAPGTMDIYDYISLTFTEPLATAADGAIHLKQKVDSLWNDVPYDFVPDSLNLMRYNVYADWVPGESYAFEVDSTAFHGIYGLFTDKIKKEFKVKKPEEYGQIFYNVTGADSIAFVELLDAQDKVVRTVPVVDGKADFYFLNPGKYSARLINDTNGNGVWDTGKYEDKRQPEKVYYYPQVIELKANFDLTQDWNIHEKPLDKQKPDELKKQKPDEDKKKRNQNNRSSGNNR